MPLLTESDVVLAAGLTFFHGQPTDDGYTFSSRDHGDIGSGIAGEEDIAEGDRLGFVLRQKFPAYPVSVDSSDEWVSVTIRFTSLTDREASIAAQSASREEVAPKVISLSRSIGSTHTGFRLYFDSGYRAEYQPFSPAKLVLTISYGERLDDRRGDAFRFKTSDDALSFARTILPLVVGLPIGAWIQKPLEPLYERKALMPPYLVVDRSSKVEFFAPFLFP
jgi:hypothetical protein